VTLGTCPAGRRKHAGGVAGANDDESFCGELFCANTHSQ